MIEVASRKLKMITEEETYILNGTIQEWSDKLNIPSFCVCHRGYLVNIKYVTSITKDTVYLNNGRYKAYVSKRNYDDMKNRFMLFVEKYVMKLFAHLPLIHEKRPLKHNLLKKDLK